MFGECDEYEGAVNVGIGMTFHESKWPVRRDRKDLKEHEKEWRPIFNARFLNLTSGVG